MNSRIMLVALLCGLAFGGLQAQDRVDPYLHDFVKSLKKDDVVKTSGLKVGALRVAPPAARKGFAIAGLCTSLPVLTISLIIVAIGLEDRSGAQVLTGSALGALSISVALSSIIALIKGSGAGTVLGKKPFIIFDEKGLVFDNNRIFTWADIESVDIEKLHSYVSIWIPPLISLYTPAPNQSATLCYTDRFGNMIKLTPEQIAQTPLTAQNIAALSKHYIKEAQALGAALTVPSKMNENNDQKPVVVQPVVEQPVVVKAEVKYQSKNLESDNVAEDYYEKVL